MKGKEGISGIEREKDKKATTVDLNQVPGDPHCNALPQGNCLRAALNHTCTQNIII